MSCFNHVVADRQDRRLVIVGSEGAINYCLGNLRVKFDPNGYPSSGGKQTAIPGGDTVVLT